MGDLGEFIRGGGISKADLRTLGMPAVHYGQIHTKYGVSTNTTLPYIDAESFSHRKKAFPGDVLIATTAEDVEAVGKACAWLGSTEIAISGDMFTFRTTADARYIAYFFQSTAFQEQKKRYITGTKVKRISAKDLSKIKLVLPPLEEQRRIADILDSFDALVNDLTPGLPAEIEARRQQ